MSHSREAAATQANTALELPKGSAVPRLTAMCGPSKGRALALAQTLATVGRHATNDLVIADPRVSGVHLELRRVGDRVRVRDASSTNGTWLGPHRVMEIELASGGEFTIGDTVLAIDADVGAMPAQSSVRDSFGELVGASTPMRELFATLERIAPKAIGVLIHGETGTGKEAVARAIHAGSPRARGPFVVIDSTAVPEALAESWLFGHEAGAVPGATGGTEARVGLLEAASGGTVLLDEVGEMPAGVQAKFLRVLERQEITRVGASAPLTIDVRFIAATHHDLRHEIEAGRFREDLYFRLAQLRLMLPPLRDREGDLPLICTKLLASIAPGHPVAIDAEATAHLAEQPWPGNIRELRNVLARAVALMSGSTIGLRDVRGEGAGFRGTREERDALDLSGTFVASKERSIERFESAYLAALMRRSQGNLSLAAREADVARHHLRDLLKKRGLYGASWADEQKT